MVCSNAHVLPSEHMSMTVLGWSKADHLLFLLILFGSSGTIIVPVNPAETSTTTTTTSATTTITEITS